MAPILESITAPVAAEMASVDRELARILEPEAPDLPPLLDHISRFSGKRLRPLQVLLAGRTVGGLTPAHIRVACIAELIHQATLVHDDVLDGALVRRRVPALHLVSGVEAAVLVGDYIYAAAFNAATELEDQTCSRVLSRITRQVCQGEITQVLNKARLGLTEADYFWIIGAKTACLYGAACQLGAHYAGASPEQAEQLRLFGFELGQAFQIVDDCLDLAGTEEQVGKTLGTDLVHGKMTLPLIHLVGRASPQVRAELDEVYDRLEPEERSATLAGMLDLEVGLEYARERAAALARQALGRLAGLPSGPALEALEAMAQYVLDRDR